MLLMATGGERRLLRIMGSQSRKAPKMYEHYDHDIAKEFIILKKAMDDIENDMG